MTRSNSSEMRRSRAFERVALDRQRAALRCVRTWSRRDATLVSSARNDRRAALLRADRGTGAGGDAARGGRVRAPARTRRRLRQAARPAGRDLARVDDGLARAPARRPRRVDRRGGAARRGRRARVVAPAAAAVGGDDAPLPAVVGGHRAGRVRRDGAARRLLARRLADREADGHGVHQRRRRRGLVPARGPVDGGRGPQLLLPRPPDGGGAREALGRRARRRLQPRRRRLLRALRGRGVRARRGAGGARGRRAVGGRAGAAGRARSAPGSTWSATAGRCAATTGSAHRA